MALAFDAIIRGTNDADHTQPITQAHTITGTNPVLFVAVAIDISGGAQTVSSATWNGTALTLLTSVSNAAQCRIELWQLTAPVTGTHNAVVTLTGTAHATCEIFSYTGASQTSPIGVVATPVTGSGGTSATAAVSLTTGQANSWLICTIATEGDVLSSPSDNQRANSQDGVQNGVQDKATTTTGSNTLSWTVTNAGGIQGWGIVMVELKVLTIQNLTLTAVLGIFTLTGISALLSHLRTLTLSTGNYTLTGSIVRFIIDGTNTIWTKVSKSSAAVLTAISKNVASWTNPNQNSSNWNNQNKN